MASVQQYVTLVVQGGTPVRLADQIGAPYPTTGQGALVFANGPDIQNLTLTNPIFAGGVTATDGIFSGDITTTAGAINFLGVTTGSGDQLVITSDPAITSLATGVIYSVKAHAANLTPTPTIAINNTGAKTIVKRVNSQLAPSDYETGQFIQLQYDGNHMVLINPAVGSLPTIGSNNGVQWGTNGHPMHGDSPYAPYTPGNLSLVEQLALVEALGFTQYRCDFDANDTDHFDMLSNLLAAAAETKVTIVPIIAPDALSPSYDSEPLAYDFGWALAFAYTANFPSVQVWEIGNEMESNLTHTGEGSFISDWDRTEYVKFRGLVRGLLDGARAGNPNCKLAFGTAGFGVWGITDALWADGIRWDITVEHFYSDGGTNDITAMPFAVGTKDKLAILRDHYGKPIWMTELNYFNTIDEPASKVTMGEYLVTTMGQYNGIARQYGLEAVHIYELLDEPQTGPGRESAYGLAGPDGTVNEAGNAVGDVLFGYPSVVYDDNSPLSPTTISKAEYFPPPPLGVAAGTSNAMTITPLPPLNTLVRDETYTVQAPNAANSVTNPTITITLASGTLGALTIFKRASTALAANDITANKYLKLLYTGTSMVLLNPAVN